MKIIKLLLIVNKVIINVGYPVGVFFSMKSDSVETVPTNLVATALEWDPEVGGR